MKIRHLFLSLLATAGLAAAADSPLLIPFQAQLTNQQNVLYQTGQYTITFNLYEQAVGGASEWTERHEKVGVINGSVNVFLGSGNVALPAEKFTKTLYLGITIDADDNPNTPDPEMVPRQMIVPAFHAKNAEKLAGHDWSSILVGGSNDPNAASIRGSAIETGGITGVQIANGAVGEVNLAAQSVTASKLAPATITSAQLAPDAVTPDKISPEMAIFKDVKPFGINGGTGPNATWARRDLNTVEYNGSSSISLNPATSVVTLQPGSYHVRGYAPAHNPRSHRAAWYNLTSSSFAILGSNEAADAASLPRSTRSVVEGVVTVPAGGPHQFELRHWMPIAGNGLDFGHSSVVPGQESVYSVISIFRIR